MNLPISAFVYSVDDRAYLLEKLSYLEQNVFDIKKTFAEKVHESLSLPIAEAIIQAADESKTDVSSPSVLQKFLRDQQLVLKSLPVVTLRLSFSPTSDYIRSISKWFDTDLNMKIVINTHIDPSLLGGVAIELEGRYIDLSLKKLLQEKMKSHMEATISARQP